MKKKKQMNNKIKIGMLLLIAALLVVPGVSATPTYYGVLQSIYGGPATCQYDCHNSAFTFNSYGNAFKAQPNYNDVAGGGTKAALTAVGPPLATISVTPGNASLAIPGTQTFTAATLDLFGNQINAAVTWKSSNTAVGTINSAGLFTAVGAGTATITASGGGTGSGPKTGTATATVSAPTSTPVLTTITVSPASASKLVGGTQTFTAAGFDQFGAPITISPAVVWSSSNTTVGTINPATGVFNALAAGKTTITARNGTSGTFSGTASVAVTSPEPQALTTITVIPSIVSLTVNDTQIFTAIALDQFANTTPANITWNSSDTTVGTIDASGNFKALAVGTTTIKAENGTINGTAVVTVTTLESPVLTTITVSPSTASLAINGTQTFTATASDQLGHIISAIFTWVSSDTTVGTIDASGNFTALSAGTTTITAANGTINGSANVSVRAPHIGTNEQEEDEQEHEHEHINTIMHNNTVVHTNNTREHINTIMHNNTVIHTNNTREHTNIIEHTNAQGHKGTSGKNKQD